MKKTRLAKRLRQIEVKIVSFVYTNNLPFTLTDNLVDLIKDLFPGSDTIKNLKLKRLKATQLLCEVLGPFSNEYVYEKLRKTKFSLIIDETTDVETRKT